MTGEKPSYKRGREDTQSFIRFDVPFPRGKSGAMRRSRFGARLAHVIDCNSGTASLDFLLCLRLVFGDLGLLGRWPLLGLFIAHVLEPFVLGVLIASGARVIRLPRIYASRVSTSTLKDHLVTWVGQYLVLKHGESRAAVIMADIDRR